MTAIGKVIALAKSEIGYIEKASNRDLDDPKANPSAAGSGNWTKYARDLDAIGFYNTKKNGYPWCDVFFDWLLYRCFGLEILMRMTGQPKGAANSGAGCGDSMYFYRQIGQVFDTPKVGDQIFFWNSTRTAKAHTGLVVKVENGRVYTIEGNTSASSGVVSNGGCVAEKSYSLDYYRIAGYGRPKYELAEKEEKTMFFGVDLSEFQEGIDFNKLKAEGVEFVILRGGDGDYQDKAFDAHYEAAEKQDMPVGAYWLSRATTVQRARQEAETMCRRLKGKRITLPVYIDCEANALRSIGKQALTDVVLAWAEVIRSAGYIPGVYTTEEWLNNYMILDELDGVEKWISKWSASKPKLDCGMWQFGGETNYLRSPKIAGYTVDQNYMYKNYLEVDMKRFYTLADLKADENAKKYYLPTVEKLLAKGAGSKGGSGDDTIIDISEDFVRLLAILDKIGVLDSDNATVNAAEIAELIKVPTVDEIAADIANRISNG